MTENAGRAICWFLAGVDLVLGTVAVFLPSVYFHWIHPNLPEAEWPVDLVARTGLLWLMFLVFQVWGAVSRSPAKWFFGIALLRFIEVPADVGYALLARGRTPLSQALLFCAPPANAVFGVLLLLAARRITTAPQSRRTEK